MIKCDVQNYISGGSSFTRHKLKLTPGRLLGETRLSLVWGGLNLIIVNDQSYPIITYYSLNAIPSAGTYLNNAVAIKINTNENNFKEEMKGFEALNATVDKDIETHGIPKVYFSGRFMYRYHAIAMSLFDGTLEDRKRKLKKENKQISELSLLLIFRRAVRKCRFYFNFKNFGMIFITFFI